VLSESSTVKWRIRSRPSSTLLFEEVATAARGPKKSNQERRNILRTALRRKEGRTRDHEGSRSSTSVLAHKDQKEQAPDEFPFRFSLCFDTTAQSAWLLWLVGPGVKRGGIQLPHRGTGFARREKWIPGFTLGGSWTRSLP
jgi:hypothetical protein